MMSLQSSVAAESLLPWAWAWAVMRLKTSENVVLHNVMADKPALAPRFDDVWIKSELEGR